MLPGKKCPFIAIIFVSVAIVFFMYQVRSFERFLNWNHFKEGRFIYFDSENVLQNCVISFLAFNGLERYLVLPNNSYPFYQSFHHKPLKYDIIGRECASKFYEGQHNTAMKKYLKSCFYPFKIAEINRKALRKSLELIKKSFYDHKLELVLTGGSFIGSWRYHQIIPYDDDIDFYILHNQKPEIKFLLESLSAKKENRFVFRDTELTNQHWKLGIVCDGKFMESCLLQIDFFFMWQEGDSMRFLEAPGSIKLADHYPLKWRPFETVLFQSPNNFNGYLKRQYAANSSNICQFKNHADSAIQCLRPAIDCDQLRFIYPYKLTAAYKSLNIELIVHKMTVTSVYIF